MGHPAELLLVQMDIYVLLLDIADQTDTNLCLPNELLVEHMNINLCPPDKLIVEQMDINLRFPEKHTLT